MKLLLASLLVLLPVTVHAEYLGNLSANEFDPNSIANPFGAGSPYSLNSVTNQFGLYGSPYSNRSANNPYATEAPRLYDQQGNYRGELSTNPYDPDSVSNPYGRYGSPYSLDSLNNQFGAGSPYRSDSPTNPYGRGWHIEGQSGPTTMPPPGHRAPVFLPSPSHTPAIIPFAQGGGAQWDYDMANMDASLQREEMLMHRRMGELLRMQAQEERDDEARMDREVAAEMQQLDWEVYREMRRAERARLETTRAEDKAARDLAQEQRQRRRREAKALAKQALSDLGLTQSTHFYLFRNELAERKRTDPEQYALWQRTTTREQRFKKLAHDVLEIVCAVGTTAGCPRGH